MVVAGVAAALVLSLAWCLAALRLGPRLGFVDEPDDPVLKRHHLRAVPLGGVGVLLGVAGGWLIAGGIDPRVIVPAGIVVVLGLVDDRIGLAPWMRLLAELAIGVAAVAAGAVPFNLSHPLELVVAVILVVVAINAVNLFDGLDGLAGSAGMVAALGVALLAVARGVDSSLGFVLTASLAGFLIFNRPPARVFLGDNGAYLLGFLLAVGVMRSSPQGLGLSLVIACVVLGVFLLDLSVTVLRRRLRGMPVFSGDRGHLYDRLADRGWSIPRLMWTSMLAQVAFVALALALDAIEARPAMVFGTAGLGALAVVVLAVSFDRPVPQAESTRTDNSTA